MYSHSPMKRYFLLISALIFTAVPSLPDIMEYAKGRTGTALKNSFRIHCTPQRYDPVHTSQLPDIYLLNGDDVLDMLSNSPITSTQASILPVIPPKWMEQSPLESNRIMMDLHNLLLTETTIAVDRESFPFAPVSKTTEVHGNVNVGYSHFRNDLINAIEPADESKGNIARIIFYGITVYPIALWTDWGSFLFENNPYPSLSPEAIELYMEWHRSDPVDMDELNRCMEINELQGNINPFVTNPEIAEYLWGKKAGEIYGIEEPQIQEMLKASYSKHRDAKISLKTPYLPDTSQWWIDGKKIDGELTTASLSEGKHELRFKSSESYGKLIITITK